eukprot:TRINITY_DN865_c0_g1_i2.p1 TRINITY_DN865_c0_g1~~TRINITY_DN865_c0_g1_i2.p1  ORF type:complete len:167 (+),score=38.76 TRINITY_DN865_c0_g1_i2:182-682(+)
MTTELKIGAEKGGVRFGEGEAVVSTQSTGRTKKMELKGELDSIIYEEYERKKLVSVFGRPLVTLFHNPSALEEEKHDRSFLHEESDSNDGNPSFEVCHFEGSFLDVPVPRVLQYICQYILTYGIYVDNLFQRSIDENRQFFTETISRPRICFDYGIPLQGILEGST